MAWDQCFALVQSQNPLRVFRAPLRSSTPRPFGAPPDSGGSPPDRFRAKAAPSRVIESVPSRASRSTFRKTRIQEHEMGKGDRKTAKGKRYNSSYGNARTHVATKAPGAASAPVDRKSAAKGKTVSVRV